MADRGAGGPPPGDPPARRPVPRRHQGSTTDIASATCSIRARRTSACPTVMPQRPRPHSLSRYGPKVRSQRKPPARASASGRCARRHSAPRPTTRRGSSPGRLARSAPRALRRALDVASRPPEPVVMPRPSPAHSPPSHAPYAVRSGVSGHRGDRASDAAGARDRRHRHTIRPAHRTARPPGAGAATAPGRSCRGKAARHPAVAASTSAHRRPRPRPARSAPAAHPGRPRPAPPWSAGARAARRDRPPSPAPPPRSSAHPSRPA